MIVLDCLKPISHKKLIEKELEGFGIRLNKRPPGITFRKKEKGGVSLTTTISEPKLDLDCKFSLLLMSWFNHYCYHRYYKYYHHYFVVVIECFCVGAAVKAVCSEYRIHNADVHLKEDCDVDDLVDCIEGSRVYIPCIYVLNKIDQVRLCPWLRTFNQVASFCTVICAPCA